ncbi:unnamed protein product [Angiostrongylus costaricensis]|uniref:Transposase n=1 Tax=Angiostrongylus costaricensis TaxID=334426 RepID=A0A0R3P9Q0_ANGCS|nr:unnamed protein product [Angiostrongylus costaricensis]
MVKAGKSARKAHRSFANYKTKMIAFRRPDGTVTASRNAIEKIIHEYYSDLFLNHVHLPSYEIKEDRYVVPPVLPSEIRYAILSVKNRAAPDDTVLITPDINLAERMLADFDKACGKIGLPLNLPETMFTRSGLVSYAPFTLNGTNISERSSYVYLGREIDRMSDLAPELSRSKQEACGAFKSIGDTVKRTRSARLRAHLFDTCLNVCMRNLVAE